MGNYTHKNHNHVKLTKKQKAFCHSLVEETDFDANEAVVKAGYAPKDAKDVHQFKRDLMRNPKVKAFIYDLLREKKADTELDKVLVIEKLKNTIKETEGKNYGAHLKALELLGKCHGMFDTKEKESAGSDPAKAAEELYKRRRAKIIEMNKKGEENDSGEKTALEPAG